MSNKHYKPKEFAGLLGVTVRTLQNWDYTNKLVAFRTPTNRRYYTRQQYLDYIGMSITENSNKNIVIYSRVSTKNQKDDLKNQTKFLSDFCNARGLIVNEIIEDFGSGLNYNRIKWNNLLDSVMDEKVSKIVVSHKDRFIRFGFDWFEKFCNKFGTEIIVVNNESLSPQQELVEDITSILHVFSCRLYGLRKYKKQISEDSEINEELQN